MGDEVAEFRWTNTGIVSEGGFFAVGGENVWSHKWLKAEVDAVQLPHPSYPTQTHRFSVYRIERPVGEVRFAAAEVSPNVWAFYV
jgi:hypothetical protein